LARRSRLASKKELRSGDRDGERGRAVQGVGSVAVLKGGLLRSGGSPGPSCEAERESSMAPRRTARRPLEEVVLQRPTQAPAAAGTLGRRLV
jgi:hypothetical protein